MWKKKEELKKFLIWLRNGTSFCFTWFLILLLAYHSCFDIPSQQSDLSMCCFFASAV